MRLYFRMPVTYASFLLSESLEQVRQWSTYDEGFPLMKNKLVCGF